MKKCRFSEAQITNILKEAQGGVPVAELCRSHGISNATFYSWRSKYGGMDASMIAELKSLQFERIIEWREKPAPIRCDNGPEYISGKIKDWAEKHQIDIAYIQPVNPQQNACVERFNRTVRYDLLNQDIFYDIEEVQEKATKWLWHYNNERPNMGLGGITPRQKLKMLA